MIRLLNPDFDGEQLERLMWQYYEEEKTRPAKSLYHIHTIESLCNRLISNFQKRDPGFIVSGEFDGDVLKGIAAGMTMSFLWSRPQTVFPQWYLNFVYNKKDWSAPKPRVHSLVNPIVSHMESMNFYSFYKVTKIPKRVNASNADMYMATQYNKLISNDRYTAFIETIIQDTSEITKLNSTYRSMLPPELNTEHYNAVIMSHHLKNGLRNLGVSEGSGEAQR
jgi:hypothetical protein